MQRQKDIKSHNDQNLLSINKNQRNMEFTKKVYSTVIVLMLLCLSPLTAQAQMNTVKGTVTSSDGPVIGATVKVKGS